MSHRTRRHVIGGTLVCALALGHMGCGTDRGYVQREWSRNMRELGIVPVFPPREDVFVGDLYASVENPDSEEMDRIFMARWSSLSKTERARRQTIGMAPRLMRLNLNEAISQEYARTLSAPATPEAYNSILGNASAGAIADLAEQARRAAATHTATKAAKQKELEALARTVAAAERNKARADRDLERAEADVTRATDGDDRDALRARVRAALEAQRIAEDALIAAQHERTDRSAILDRDIAELDVKIVAAEDEAKAKAALAKSVGASGEKLLYAQPAYAGHNVYTGEPLPAGEAAMGPAIDSRLNRLRLVGFPEFVSASFTKGDLAALIPIEAFSLGLNLSSSSVSKVSVKVPAAESYGISTGALLDSPLFEDRLRGDLGADWRALFESLARQGLIDPDAVPGAGRRVSEAVRSAARLQVGFDSRNDDAPTEIFIRVITEVFYARALDVSIFHARASGGRATLRPTVPTGTGAGGTPTSTPSATLANPGDPLAGVLESIGQTYDVPGGSVQIVNANSYTIGLRRVFDHPVAIGFRGVTLRVGLKHGDILDSKPIGGMTPQIILRLAEPTPSKSSD